MRRHWLLDPDVAFCNNGSFGATPRVVLEAQRAEQDAMERQPVAYLLGIGPRLRAAAEVVGQEVGAEGRDIVFVDNATTGVNTVLAGFPVRPGDVWLTTTHVYHAVRNAMRHFVRRGGGDVREADVPFPLTSPDQVVETVAEAFRDDVSLLVIDHITSATGLVFPVERLIDLARRRGVPVLVDGAHAPGQLALDIAGLGADWYVGNLHKWFFTPKGCAILWARRDRQEGLHPLVISHGYGAGYHEEFDWTGTRDPSAMLVVPAAQRFVNDVLGGFGALRGRQRALRAAASARVRAAWGTGVVAPEGMLAALETLELPFFAPPEQGPAIHDALLARHGVEIPVFPFAGRCWTRLSAQVYTRDEDWDRLAAAVGPEGVRPRA